MNEIILQKSLGIFNLFLTPFADLIKSLTRTYLKRKPAAFLQNHTSDWK